jgi:hypothetical protein
LNEAGDKIHGSPIIRTISSKNIFREMPRSGGKTYHAAHVEQLGRAFENHRAIKKKVVVEPAYSALLRKVRKRGWKTCSNSVSSLRALRDREIGTPDD